MNIDASMHRAWQNLKKHARTLGKSAGLNKETAVDGSLIDYTSNNNTAWRMYKVGTCYIL